MAKIKILTIVGTRPEAIKLAPVVLEFRQRGSAFSCFVCATGQHREMVDQVLPVFGIQPDHDLGLMLPAQSLAQITARAVEGLNAIIERESPDVVVVQGDTTTAFCGALAAYYHKKKVAHVEAGLRTGDRFAPYPEEINRRLISSLTDYHFAPTEGAKAALLAEGNSATSIFVTGNTVIDALMWVRELVRRERPDLPAGLANELYGRQFVLITGHRRESFGKGFENICAAIREAADTLPDVLFVYAVHLNPNVREPVNRLLGGHKRIRLIEPQAYLAFVWLMDQASLILTDSGGVQEEAPSLGKPVLVMRRTTERPEGVAAGNARLVGVTRDTIAEELIRLLSNAEARSAMAATSNPYGDGFAAKRIADVLSRVC
jgi:UDP-N-acetylglucosamine 2-epimerase (non-hydrolysing)